MKPTYKGKNRTEFVASFFRARTNRWKLVGCVAAASFLIVAASHRFASYQMNHRTLSQAPIHHMERTCPTPGYDVIGATATSAQKQKICITTLTDAKKADTLQRLVRWRNFDSLLDMTLPNKSKYAQKYGYYLYDESDSLDNSRPPSWSKIRAAQRLLTEEKCDWVFWMDADTVIMNDTIRLESFLPRDKDLVITKQKGKSYNAGAWIIRNTQWSRDFLDRWWSMSSFVQPKGLSVSGDNDALKAFLTQQMNPQEFQQHIAVPPRCTFNSVTVFLTDTELAEVNASKEALEGKHWFHSLEAYHKGDFVAHVAGKNNKIDTTKLLLADIGQL